MAAIIPPSQIRHHHHLQQPQQPTPTSPQPSPATDMVRLVRSQQGAFGSWFKTYFGLVGLACTSR
nr:hypothetical protein [Tanacetum cinerariifolium]